MPEYRFNPPPGWPSPPEGWRPHGDWKPDAAWPEPPESWEFWLEVVDPYAPPAGAMTPYQMPPSIIEYSRPPQVQISPRMGYNNIPIVYNRQQTGHSIVLHSILPLFTFGFSLIWTLYYIASPNHYWHV